MLICTDCGREMTCIRTGTWVHYGNGLIYPGDTFLCSKCQTRVTKCNERSATVSLSDLEKKDMSGRFRHVVEMTHGRNDG